MESVDRIKEGRGRGQIGDAENHLDEGRDNPKGILTQFDRALEISKP